MRAGNLVPSKLLGSAFLFCFFSILDVNFGGVIVCGVVFSFQFVVFSFFHLIDLFNRVYFFLVVYVMRI